MGRSTQEKAAENRERIIDCACALFRERGVENVSVAEVMAANGMTVGGFYKQFASKDELVNAAFSRTFSQSAETWARVLKRADAKGKSPRGELVHQYLTNPAAKSRCPLVAFASHANAAGPDTPASEAYANGAQQLLNVFVDEGDEGKESGRKEAMVLFAAMVGARVLHEAAGDVPWVREMREAVRTLSQS